MRKADYLTVARTLRKRIDNFSPAEGTRLNECQEEYVARYYDNLQASQLARYFADHLSVDRVEFLNACGIRP